MCDVPEIGANTDFRDVLYVKHVRLTLGYGLTSPPSY
jgi:hypothetical protein